MNLDMKKYITIVCSLVLLSACTGQLDVTPNDPDVILVDDFYTTPEAYKQGLAGVYGNLSLTGPSGPGSSSIQGLDAGTSQYGRGLWNLNELTSDGAVWSWENDPGLRSLNRNTWSATNPILRGMFGRLMNSVSYANEYLRQTTDGALNDRGVDDATRADIQVYRAEARFLRAMAYYNMMDLFGQAPMITEDDPVGAYQAPKADRAELFAYVESELLAILPEMAEPLMNEYARADKAAAWMLLAKIYLNAEVYIGQDRYADCLSYCEDIIASGFELTPDYLMNFMADNDETVARNEIIFPVVSDGITTQNYGPTTVMINGQVGSTEANGGDFGVAAGGWGGALRVTQQFSEVFMNGSYGTDDRNTLITADRTIEVSDIADRSTGYIIGKWSNKTSGGANGSANEIVDTDFPMFRLADVYLMYAEAHLRGGGGSATTAVGYINDLRTRANNPNTIGQSALTLDLILDERQVELHWEAHRRQDLIRFGKYTGSAYNWSWKGNAPNGIPLGAHMAIYPIPEASLAANPNLTQNPGY